MPEDEYLWKEFKEAQSNRDITPQQMAYELGITREYLYKVVQGKKRPGKKLVPKLAKSLEVSDEYAFKKLHPEESKKEPKKITEIKASLRNFSSNVIKRKIAPILITGCITILASFFYLTNSSSLSTAPTTNKPRIEGDKSKFIIDVTIPDGTPMPPDTDFIKIWRIKNTGSVPWKGRYLLRVTEFNNLICHSDNMIPIKDTMPGETVDIEVKFTSISLPGSCRTDWKMVDVYGTPFFPNKHGLYSIVNITNDYSLVSPQN